MCHPSLPNVSLTPCYPIVSSPIPCHVTDDGVTPDDSVAGAGGSGVGGAGGTPPSGGVLLEQLMDLLDRPLYTMSGPDLDDLLQLIEVLVAPLANLKEKTPAEQAAAAAAAAAAEAGASAEAAGEEAAAGAGAGESAPAEEESKMEVDSPPPDPPGAGAGAGAGAAGAGAVVATAGAAVTAATVASEKYEWVKVPAPVVQHARLRLLCSVLRLEACSDSSFQVRRGTVR